jgi:predicted outer membrane repeat protein
VQLDKEFRAEDSAKLAFKALTLNGQPGGLLRVGNTASLAADSAVMRDFPGETIFTFGGSVTLDNVKVSGSGGSSAVDLRSTTCTWSNVSEQPARQCLLSLSKGGSCSMLPPPAVPCFKHLGISHVLDAGFVPSSHTSVMTPFVCHNNNAAVAVVALSRQVEFADNKGSAVSASFRTALTITGTARFLRNGDSVVSTSGSLTLEDAEFVDNEGFSGGAINVLSGSVTVTGRLLVQGNRAAQDGGSIFASGGRGGAQLDLQGETLMTGNSAGGNGGAIALQGPSAGLTVSGAARLSQNRAGVRGEALYLASGLISAAKATVEAPSGSLCISGNSAADAGGGVYMEESTQLLLNSDANVAGGNTPNDIAVANSPRQPGGFICNSGGLRGEGTYFVNGPICS